MNSEQLIERYTELTRQLAVDDFIGGKTNWSEKELQMKLKYEILFEMKLSKASYRRNHENLVP